MTLVRLFVFFGGLLVLGLFTLLIGPYFVDWSVYRADFEREASRILGQKVVVQGETELRLLPFPSVTFNELEIGENQSGQPMMTAKTFEMDMEITPFLRGEILIFDMRVNEPSLTVTLFDDGTLDWALRSEKQLAGNTLVLENVSIENGTIRLVDLQNDRSQRFDNINAQLSAPELSGPWRIVGTTEYKAQNIAYNLSTGLANPNGTIRLRSNITVGDLPLFMEAEGDAQIKDNKPSYKGGFTIQKMPDKNVLNTPAHLRPLLSIQLKGDFEIDNERLNIPEFRMASGNPADPYVIEGNADIDTGQDPNFTIFARGQQINVEQLSNNRTDSSNTSDNTLQNGISRLKDIISQVPNPRIPGTIDLSLPAIVAGNTTVRDVKLIAAPLEGGWDIDQFDAKLPGRTSIEANGELLLGDQTSFAGKLLIASQQPSGFSSWLIGKVDPEIRQLGAAGISAQVLLNQDIQKFESLELILGQSVIQGRAERQAGSANRPSITFDLTGDEIDINKISAVLKLANLDGNINEGGTFLNHDIIAKINTDNMRYEQISAQDVEAIVSWQTGDLLLEKVQFTNFAGTKGNISGSIEQLTSEPMGQIDFAFTSENPTPLLGLMSKLSNQHLLVERLRKKSDQFQNLSSSGSLKIGSDHIPTLDFTGDVNGTNFNVSASGQTLLTQIFDNPSTPLALNISAQNPESHVLLAQAGFDVLPFDFEERGTLDISVSRGFTPDLDVKTQFKSGNTEVTADGFVNFTESQELEDAKGSFTVDIQSSDIEPLLITFGQNLPGLGNGQPLNLQTTMSIDKTSIILSDIAGDADGNRFSGEINADRTQQNPTLSGELTLNQIDFEWLYEMTLGVRLLDLSETVWSQTEFLPPYEGSAFADIELTADRVAFPTLRRMNKFQAKLVLEPGLLNLSDVQSNWYGGKLSGDLSITNPDGKAFLSLNGMLENANTSQLAWVSNEEPILSGRIDINGNLEGTGVNLDEIVRSANGGGLYTLKNLAINNFQPDVLSDILSKADEEGFEITPEAIGSEALTLMQDGSYSVSDIALPFTLTGGVQRISSINVKDDVLSITGRARLDLATQQVDAQLDLLFDAGLEAQSGATPELTYDFDGQIGAPNRSIDANAFSNFLSIRAYENERRRVELLQASILEKQRLRRETALVKDQQLKREEVARLKAEEEARIKAEAEARRQAELNAQLAAEAEAQRLADEALQRAQRGAGSVDWQKSVEDILNNNNRSTDIIEITPLDAPLSQ